MATPAPGAANLVQEIDLILSAKNLPDKDTTSKSDPMCVVWTRPSNTVEWSEHGRTEVILNTLNPEFNRKIRIGYRFEEQQHIKFGLYDVDKPIGPLNQQDFLGETPSSTLGQIVSSGQWSTKLSPGHGTFLVRVQDASNLKEVVDLQLQCRRLTKSGLFSLPDPFLAIYRLDSGGQPILVHRTLHINDTLDPSWPKFNVPLYWLQVDGPDTRLLIQCLNHNSDGNHKLMGEVRTKLSDFLKPQMLQLKNPKKDNKNSGELHIIQCNVRRTFSFLDYVMGGTQLNCTFAIDFTASNGAANNPSSLHFMGAGATQYEIALQSIGNIIQDYDTDKQFPVLGFGARLPPDFALVTHEFFVNLSRESPFCAGIPAVIQAYRHCLNVVQLYGPTHFAPVINHVARFAVAYPKGDNYFILLILTDGAICDMEQTKKAIVEASSLPISIIIVGIGSADFSSMKELDGDNICLSSKGKPAARDIVQFVAFRDFLHFPDPLRAGQELARQLLAEIPTQLVSYMSSKNLKPIRNNADPKLGPMNH